MNIEKVEAAFQKQGYRVLQNHYKNAHSKIQCISPTGLIGSISWNHWKKGVRLRLTNTIDTFLIVAKGENYTVLSSPTKIKETVYFICPNGHIGKTTPQKFLGGQRCGECYNEIRPEIQRLKESDVKKYLEAEGYKLISQYKNCDEPVKLECPNKHKFQIRFADFKRGHRCKKCYDLKRGKSLKLDFNKIKESFKSEGYTLLTDKYSNENQKLEYICPKGHKGSINFGNWKNKGTRCPKCVVPTSKAETEIVKFLKKYVFPVQERDRNLITPLELDIIIPSKKIAIEYCGLYWHSEKYKDKSYHLNKLNRCKDIGYRLITVFEDEWLSKKDIVKSRLLNILGVSDKKKIYARKCRIVEIPTKVKNEFLNKNHIQGKDISSVKLGAFYKDELVSVMTFSKGNVSKGSRSHKNVWELNRFCSDTEYTVVGIASKLLKYFIRHYKPKEIFSYSDNRWSDGNLYRTIGFELSHSTSPNYWYVLNQKRMHRFNFRKNVLKDKLEIFDPNLTEVQNMHNNNYRRIWDCGSLKWRLE